MSGQSQTTEQKNYHPLPNQQRDNPPDPFFPTEPDKLRFATSYFGELGKSYMYTIHNSDKVILIDKNNLVFSSKLIKKLTNKNNHYIFSFSPEQAEKYHNQDHVYYFSESNDNFSVMIKILGPVNPKKRSERKFAFLGYSSEENGVSNYLVFDNWTYFLDVPTEESPKVLFISKNHSQIKELLQKGKIQSGKHFIIRYGTPNMTNKQGKKVFEEFNQELEILEA